MHEIAGNSEYRPILLSRRGEITAWALTAVVCVTVLVLLLFNGTVPFLAISMVGLFFLSSISITFGNWLDRKTIIMVDIDGISFKNGLRNTQFLWDQIKEVHKLPARWGKKIYVVGEDTGFSFNLMGEIRLNGEIRGRVGFENGEEILGIIVKNSKLLPAQEQNNKVYYHRK